MDDGKAEARLAAVIERHAPRLLAMTEDEASRRRAKDAWSIKEIVGHLIDSATNNHGRFVRAQFTDDLVFPGYEQDRWVEAQRYDDAPWTSLVTLWRELNLHLVRVFAATPDEARMKVRVSHNLDRIAWQTVPPSEAVTLDSFMHDYVGHLEHHLGQITATRG